MSDLSAQNLALSYGTKSVIASFSHDFKPGQWTHLIGPNGSGKTTLIRALTGLLPAHSGDILLNQQSLSKLPLRQRARLVAYVPQRLEDLPPISVLQFVEQGAFAQNHQAPDEIRQITIQALKETQILHLQDRRFDQISCGERQLCVIASALVQQADIILLDEPTTGLDMHHALKICQILRQYADSGKTIISSTHELHLARQFADQTILISNGKCLWQGEGFPDNALISETFHIQMDAFSRFSLIPVAAPQPPGSRAACHSPRRFLIFGSLILIGCLCLYPWLGATLALPWETESAYHIFFDLRMPRILLGTLAGAVLSVVGATFQALFKNPLATPYTLGVASGASLGAFIAIQLGVYALLSLPLCACLGGIAVMSAVLWISRNARHSWFCLMSGIAASMFCTALGLVIQSFATPLTTQQMMRWQLGGLDIVGYTTFSTAPLICLAIYVLFKYAPTLNLLSVDTDLAITRGVDYRRTQAIILIATGLATSLVVSACGPIGFIGLIIPNAIRRFIGADMRTLIPVSALVGAIFLVTADTLSRFLERFTWIPVGVITALIGVPIFIYALIQSSQSHQG